MIDDTVINKSFAKIIDGLAWGILLQGWAVGLGAQHRGFGLEQWHCYYTTGHQDLEEGWSVQVYSGFRAALICEKYPED